MTMAPSAERFDEYESFISDLTPISFFWVGLLACLLTGTAEKGSISMNINEKETVSSLKLYKLVANDFEPWLLWIDH